MTGPVGATREDPHDGRSDMRRTSLQPVGTQLSDSGVTAQGERGWRHHLPRGKQPPQCVARQGVARGSWLTECAEMRNRPEWSTPRGWRDGSSTVLLEKKMTGGRRLTSVAPVKCHHPLATLWSQSSPTGEKARSPARRTSSPRAGMHGNGSPSRCSEGLTAPRTVHPSWTRSTRGGLSPGGLGRSASLSSAFLPSR